MSIHVAPNVLVLINFSSAYEKKYIPYLNENLFLVNLEGDIFFIAIKIPMSGFCVIGIKKKNPSGSVFTLNKMDLDAVSSFYLCLKINTSLNDSYTIFRLISRYILVICFVLDPGSSWGVAEWKIHGEAPSEQGTQQ